MFDFVYQISVEKLFYVLALLNLADLIITIYAIRRNQAQESNPLAKQLMKIFGQEEGLIILKVLYVIYVYHNLASTTHNELLLSILIYIGIFARNIYVINKKRV